MGLLHERREVDPAAGAAVDADVVGVERADDVGRVAGADRGDDLVVVDAADDARRVTSGCALSYSAATFLKTLSSSPALQPTQTVSFVGDACRASPAARPRLATHERATSASRARRHCLRLIMPSFAVDRLGTLTRRPYDADEFRCQCALFAPYDVRLLTRWPTRATPPLLKRLNERDRARGDPRRARRSRGPRSRAARASRSRPSRSRCRTLLDAGLVREAAARARPARRYGAVFFEPVARGGARARRRPRGALPARRALRPRAATIRARQDVELAGARRRRARSRRSSACATSSSTRGRARRRADRRRGRRRAGRRRAARRRGAARDERRRARGRDVTAPSSRSGSARRVTVENDINLAALGEQWRGVARGVDDFMFLSVGTGLGAGLVLRGELQRGHHGAAGELDYVAGRPRAGDRSVRGRGLGAGARSSPDGARATALAAPFDPRAIFAAARGGRRRRARGRARRRRGASRCTSRPIAAVADVGARRARRRHRRERATCSTDVRPLLASGCRIRRARDLEPRRRRGADGRGLGRARVGARPRLRQPSSDGMSASVRSASSRSRSVMPPAECVVQRSVTFL